MIEKLAGKTPRIHPDCFVHPSAVIGGDVRLEQGCSVWYNAALRGDEAPIRIGARCNIQDGAILHVDHESQEEPGGGSLILGENVTIGHGAIVHACHVGDNVLVGMGAIVLSGARIGDNCIIAAGALVREGQEIPAGSMVMGLPCRVVRPLTAEEVANNGRMAESYAQAGAACRAEGGGDDVTGFWEGPIA